MIDPLAGLVREADVPLEAVVTHGDPVDTIITIAQERHSDPIVLGRTGDSRVRQAISAAPRPLRNQDTGHRSRVSTGEFARVE